MAFDDYQADRIRQYLKDKTSYNEKKMMGGLIFMVNDKMCVGVSNDDLMARIDPDVYEDALTKQGCRKMDFTGREMKGFVFIDESGMKSDHDLQYWLDLALDYNTRAKSSRKKKK